MNKTEKSFSPYGCMAGGSFEVDQRLPRGCPEAVQRLPRGCQEAAQRLSRLSISFSKDAQSMLRKCKCTIGKKVCKYMQEFKLNSKM